MRQLRPTTPARRPETARRRANDEPVVDPPTTERLERIQRHLVSLPLHSGAKVRDDPDLGLLLVRSPAWASG